MKMPRIMRTTSRGRLNAMGDVAVHADTEAPEHADATVG
jgi:hypothetical protein